MNEIVHFVLIETTSCFHTPLPLVPLAVVVCFQLYFGLCMCVCMHAAPRYRYSLIGLPSTSSFCLK